MQAPLEIWCNYAFVEPQAQRLREGTAHHRLTLVDPSIDAPAGDVDVLLGQPDPAYLLDNPRARWAEITSAGYTRYDRADLRAALAARGARLTNSSRVFDEACAQHLVAMLYAFARELPRCLDNQRGERLWLHDEPRAGRRHLLNGQSVIIYGYGAIARRVVELLRPLNLRMVGVRRHPRGDETIPMLTEAEADRRLDEMDHVFDILPASDATAHYFDAARLNRCHPGAYFYNIGRGTTVDQHALTASLRSGLLAAAYLDVTDPEPLPSDHPLWSVPNCYITPHIAGTHDDEEARLVDHFLANLAALTSHRPLLDQVI